MEKPRMPEGLQETDNRTRIVAMAAAAALLLTACSEGEVEAGPDVPPAVERTVEQTPTTGGNVQFGYDVSWPQCERALPENTGSFTVVGVNGELPTYVNPCLKSQVQWAQAGRGAAVEGMPKVAAYVTIANPVEEKVATWPKSGGTGEESCKPEKPRSIGCAYQYGKERALAGIEYMDAQVGETTLKLVFIDVEREYSWATGDDAHELNRATVEGMAETFSKSGREVGIYSNRQTWETLIGSVPKESVLYGLRTWLAAGAPDIEAAQRACDTLSFLPDSRLAAVQSPGEMNVSRLDQNAAC